MLLERGHAEQREELGHAAADAIRISDRGALRDDLADVLRQIAAFLQTPLGRASLLAGLQITDEETVHPGVSGWKERWASVEPIFDRAKGRGEIDADFDPPAAFASVAGALYFRILVMGEPIDGAWIARVLSAVLP